MRGVMIGLGVAIVKQFRWIIIIFAGILLVSSWKLLQEGDEEHDLANNTVVKASGNGAYTVKVAHTQFKIQ